MSLLGDHRHALVSSPVGELTLVATEDALVGLHWEGQRMRAHFAEPGARCNAAEHPVLYRAAEQLAEYFAGGRAAFSVPLSPPGDAFAQGVWEMLLGVSFGVTTTYGAIAKELGNPALAQRVGQAVGANPVGLIIPCHRVLGANGALTGFAGGLDVKRWLLHHEEPDAALTGRLF